MKSETAYYYIYCIINLINGHTYTGQRKLKNKILVKDDNYWGSGIAIHNAINKYGLQNFKKEILWQGKCSGYEIDEIETYYIRLGKMQGKNEYNIKDVASGGDLSMFIDYTTPERKEKLSRVAKINNSRPERKLQSSQILTELNKKNKGKKHFTDGINHRFCFPGEEPKGYYEGMPFETGNKISKLMSTDKNGMSGKHWYHNDKGEIIITKTCPEGFKEGITDKPIKDKKGNTSGMSWWNNGTESKLSKQCPGKDWVKGRIFTEEGYNKMIKGAKKGHEKAKETYKNKKSTIQNSHIKHL